MQKGMENYHSSIVRQSLVLSVLLMSGWASFAALADQLPELERVRVLSEPVAIAGFELVDQNGEPYDSSQLDGKVAFVFFGFTNCRNVCPVAMQQMRLFEREGGDVVEDVALIMISVDGDRDSPGVLKEFLAAYSPRFVGLTGAPAEVRPVAKSFRSSFFKGGSVGHDGHYDVSHAPQLFVVDPAGRLRAEMYNAPVSSMQQLATAILAEPSPGTP